VFALGNFVGFSPDFHRVHQARVLFAASMKLVCSGILIEAEKSLKLFYGHFVRANFCNSEIETIENG
jgi:hypothetical protein